MQPEYCSADSQNCIWRKSQRIHLFHDLVERLGVVCLPVTFGTVVLDADKLMNRIILILRVAFLENLAGSIDQALWFDNRRDCALSKLSLGARSRVDVALAPGVNGGIATGQDGSAIGSSDCNGNISELDVIEDERPSKGAMRSIRITDENGRVFYRGIYDCFCTNSL